MEIFESCEDHSLVENRNLPLQYHGVDQVTAQGYDLQFGTNAFGHFYLTSLLLPTLIATVPKSSDGKVRVVNTASDGHNFYPKIKFETLKDGPERRKMETMTLYAQSKTANMLFAHELARRYGDRGIVSTALSPGHLKSDLQRHTGSFAKAVTSLLLFPVEYGALTQLYAGTSPEGAEFNGKYLIPWARLGEPAKATKDVDLAKKLWDWMEEQVQDI